MGDTVIISGDIVLPNQVMRDAALELQGGRISNIHSIDAAKGLTPTHDYSGQLVFPGLIDAHVHAYSSSDKQEGIERLTKGAAVGGVTTIIDMPYDRPTAITNADLIRAKIKVVQREAVVDVALFGTIKKHGGWKEIVSLSQAGVCGFKLSTYETDPDRFPKISDSELIKTFRELQKVGRVALFHAENGAIIDPLIEELRPLGEEHPEAHCWSRPLYSETTSVLKLLELARNFPVKLHIVHLTAPQGYDAVNWYRGQGVDVTAETCTQYLTLTEQALSEHRGLAKCNPPVRDEATKEELWQRIFNDEVAFITSDHAPWPLSAKQAPNIFDNASGMPGVELLFPLLFSEGVVKRNLHPSKLADLLSKGPAERYGLHPRKGTLQVGTDADITVIDPSKRWTVEAAKSQSIAQWSPYDGWEISGKVVSTFVRGQQVFDGTHVTQQPGYGQFVSPCIQ